MSYRRGYYKKDGTYVQGHFVNKGGKRRNLKKNSKSGCLGMFIAFLSIVISVSCTTEGTCKTKKCADFASQAEAQSTFESDKDCYSNLDRDNDNIACENGEN